MSSPVEATGPQDRRGNALKAVPGSQKQQMALTRRPGFDGLPSPSWAGLLSLMSSAVCGSEGALPAALGQPSVSGKTEVLPADWRLDGCIWVWRWSELAEAPGPLICECVSLGLSQQTVRPVSETSRTLHWSRGGQGLSQAGPPLHEEGAQDRAREGAGLPQARGLQPCL